MTKHAFTGILVAWILASSTWGPLGCRHAPGPASDAAQEVPRSFPRDLQSTGDTQPAYDYSQHHVEYSGPGREAPPPTGLSEIRIGWFGPSSAGEATGVAMWEGACLAVEEANAEGGSEGLPFRLLPAWSENPWGSGIRQVTRLVYRDEVWALLGAPDSASAHLMEQIVAKARLAFVSPVTTEESTNFVNVPWMFSAAPGDRAVAEALARELARTGAPKSTVLVSGTDHESRRLAAAVLSALKARETFPKLHISLRPGERDLPGTLRRAMESEATEFIVIASAADTVRIVPAIRGAGVRSPIFLGPRAGQRLCLRQSQENPTVFTQVVYPVLWELGSEGSSARKFSGRFRDRYGGDPDYTAAYSYDAMRLVIAAVRRDGLNRVRIADSLRALDGFEGVTGAVHWDPTGRRRAESDSIRFAPVSVPEPTDRDR